jgi:hypothetical protein
VVTSSPIPGPAASVSGKAAADLLAALGSVPDPRRGGARRHPGRLRPGGAGGDVLQRRVRFAYRCRAVGRSRRPGRVEGLGCPPGLVDRRDPRAERGHPAPGSGPAGRHRARGGHCRVDRDDPGTGRGAGLDQGPGRGRGRRQDRARRQGAQAGHPAPAVRRHPSHPGSPGPTADP